MHPPIPGNKPIPRHTLLGHSKVGRPVRNELIGLLERALIEQKINPLPRRKFARLSLSRPPLLAPALFRNSVTRCKLREFTLMIE